MTNNIHFNTTRLRAQLLDESNKHHVFDLYNNAQNIAFLHGIDAAQDIELSIKCSAAYSNIGAYLIFENHSNEFVGVGGIQKQEPMFDGSFAMLDHDIEFVIILSHEFKGKGYASEFCEAFFEKFFEKFPQVYIPARVNMENHACIKLLKKFGFVESGETHYHVYENKFSLLKNNSAAWKKSKNQKQV